MFYPVILPLIYLYADKFLKRYKLCLHVSFKVVWGKSALVGCGQTLCGQRMTYACNYAFG